jgi:hypothetical protein
MLSTSVEPAVDRETTSKFLLEEVSVQEMVAVMGLLIDQMCL